LSAELRQTGNAVGPSDDDGGGRQRRAAVDGDTGVQQTTVGGRVVFLRRSPTPSPTTTSPTTARPRRVQQTGNDVGQAGGGGRGQRRCLPGGHLARFAQVQAQLRGGVPPQTPTPSTAAAAAAAARSGVPSQRFVTVVRPYRNRRDTSLLM